MPYKLKGNCVVKADTGKSVPGGCHPDRKSALKHLRALMRNVKGASVDTEGLSLDEMAIQLASMMKEPIEEPIEPSPFIPNPVLTAGPSVVIYTTGTTVSTSNGGGDGNFQVTIPTQQFAPIRLYFQEGERTPDGRVIDPNCINFNRPPPYSIRLQTTQPDGGGHAGAIVCGVITKIARDGLTIVADGFLDLTAATQGAGQQAFDLITNKTMQTWSPDLGDAVIDTEENVTDEDPNLESDQARTMHFISATFLGATLVAMPALASAVVELLDDSGVVTVPAPNRVGEPALPVAVSDDPSILKYITDRQDSQPAEISACAGPMAPPAEFFSNPSMTELQRWTTITPEGRCFGHVAGRDECHVGSRRGQCVTIDLIDKDLSYAMSGYVLTSEGTRIPTGPITIKGGHALKGLRWRDALSHYDDPAAAVADVTYGWDEFGIWFSGAIRPGASEEQVHALRASGVSLDAREINGKLSMLAVCCVNTPGFPKASARILASAEGDDGRIVALIAPGGSPVPAEECGCNEPVQ